MLKVELLSGGGHARCADNDDDGDLPETNIR